MGAIACQVVHTCPETKNQRECGKDATGYSASGVAVCAECEDDDTLQIVKRIEVRSHTIPHGDKK